jgi:putative restriction endonuclease
MPRLPSKRELLDRILSAIDEGGWRSLVIEAQHPFLLRIFREDKNAFNLRIYIWNCTHGGGAARHADEYRIQLTGKRPNTRMGEKTILLGWHEGYGVFAAFDVKLHLKQASKSPSIQVRQPTLLSAHTHMFASCTRGNDEVVVAFRPEYLVDYALNMAALHGSVGKSEDSSKLLNILDTVSESKIEDIADQVRREVVATIKRKYRQHDFRHRVLTAYSQRCAMCGVQLGLVEAAHILPVAHETSTDDTKNGVALCTLHHKAYDNNLASFNEQYEVEVSAKAVKNLTTSNLIEGLPDFRHNLRPALILPADRRDYPKPEYIAEARKIRRWN